MQQTKWGPPTGGIVVAGAFGLCMLLAAVMLVTDVPGRALAGVAGVGLLAFAGLSWRARPKLAITEAGLVVRGWLGTHVIGRDDVAKIRITEFRRIGRKVRLLEIDTVDDDRLLVFTRWDLGTDPLDVLDALTAAGYDGR
ncbi:PH domain-containing protein [Mycobacterium yunnanensis]|uniref:PH domain-containing protein n=1 Tax=Mycobacterium yunnanensis TaxID=368477 RepID=A0A9X2Z077_9MYCO|nr:PH domain-containing protein [Mycobacterium yunnanensis]MCV7420691.1 PH domain-containing protein [Mycobacterium yunnanensis]